MLCWKTEWWFDLVKCCQTILAVLTSLLWGHPSSLCEESARAELLHFPVHGGPFAACLQDKITFLPHGWNHCGVWWGKSHNSWVTTFSSGTSRDEEKGEELEREEEEEEAGQSWILVFAHSGMWKSEPSWAGPRKCEIVVTGCWANELVTHQPLPHAAFTISLLEFQTTGLLSARKGNELSYSG